jgi:hypothetical protein
MQHQIHKAASFAWSKTRKRPAVPGSSSRARFIGPSLAVEVHSLADFCRQPKRNQILQTHRRARKLALFAVRKRLSGDPDVR